MEYTFIQVMQLDKLFKFGNHIKIIQSKANQVCQRFEIFKIFMILIKVKILTMLIILKEGMQHIYLHI